MRKVAFYNGFAGCVPTGLNAGIFSSKEIPAMAVPQDAASAKTAATRRFMMRYLTKIAIPGGGRLNPCDRTVSKR